MNDYFKNLEEYTDTLKLIRELEAEIETKPLNEENRTLRTRLALRKKLNAKKWREYTASCHGYTIDSKKKPMVW